MNDIIRRAFHLGKSPIQWRATFQLIFMRSVGAGLTWCIFSLFVHDPNGPNAFAFLFLSPIIGAFMVAMAIFVMAISVVFPPIGLFNIVPIFYMACGDPWVWMLSKFRPDWVPAEGFKAINLRAIIFVTDGSAIDEVIDEFGAKMGDKADKSIKKLISKM